MSKIKTRRNPSSPKPFFRAGISTEYQEAMRWRHRHSRCVPIWWMHKYQVGELQRRRFRKDVSNLISLTNIHFHIFSMATSRKRASGASTFDKFQLSEADISQTDRGWSLSFN